MDLNTLHKLACGGDGDAENRLFRELTDIFRLYARHRIQDERDVEELVQDVLAVVAEKYGGVDFTASFAAWAYKIFENKLYSFYRKKQVRQGKMVPMEGCDQNSLSYTPDPELKRRLVECLRKLGRVNNRYARILDLHFQGYSAQEIGTTLGTSKNSVLITLSRARSKLKVCIEQGDIR